MRGHSKSLLFLLVLLAHVAALLLLQRSMRPGPVPRSAPADVLTVMFLAPPVPKPERPAQVPAPRLHRREPPPVPPPAPAAPLPAPAQSNAITDFRADAADAARDIAAGARPTHAFSHEFAAAPGKPETGVFGPPNEHPAGTVEQVDGVERHWVTDNCYYDFPRHEAPALLPGPKVMSRFCKPANTGGTQMFRKMTPAYLAPPPPPGGRPCPAQDGVNASAGCQKSTPPPAQ